MVSTGLGGGRKHAVFDRNTLKPPAELVVLTLAVYRDKERVGADRRNWNGVEKNEKKVIDHGE